MKKTLYKGTAVLLFSALLVGCQDSESGTEETLPQEENDSEENHEQESDDHADRDHGHNHESEENVEEAHIEGLSDHYHTGDTVTLTASSEVDTDGHWHWYQRDDENSEWQAFEGELENTIETEAVDGMQIKAALYDDHNVVSESEAVTVSIDDHDGDVYEGYFDDEDVEDRDISDWAGSWKSVYPYFEDGELDEVYEHRAEADDDMSFEEQKEYYEVGYQTDVNNIDITEAGEITFHEGDESYTGTYVYSGYEILEYEAGNRGVRFIFQLEDGDEDAPQYIQFSDHITAPEDSEHFHLYWGDDNAELLEEMDHWPTYYPEDASVDEIVDDLMLH